jgi:hypothetical protein
MVSIISSALTDMTGNNSILSPNDVVIFSRLVSVALSILTMIDFYESSDNIDRAVADVWAASITAQRDMWAHIYRNATSTIVLSQDDERDMSQSLYAISLNIVQSEAISIPRRSPLPQGINAEFLPKDVPDYDDESTSLLTRILKLVSDKIGLVDDAGGLTNEGRRALSLIRRVTRSRQID